MISQSGSIAKHNLSHWFIFLVVVGTVVLDLGVSLAFVVRPFFVHAVSLSLTLTPKLGSKERGAVTNAWRPISAGHFWEGVVVNVSFVGRINVRTAQGRVGSIFRCPTRDYCLVLEAFFFYVLHERCSLVQAILIELQHGRFRDVATVLGKFIWTDDNRLPRIYLAKVILGGVHWDILKDQSWVSCFVPRVGMTVVDERVTCALPLDWIVLASTFLELYAVRSFFPSSADFPGK
jgi:hypothetical protein